MLLRRPAVPLLMNAQSAGGMAGALGEAPLFNAVQSPGNPKRRFSPHSNALRAIRVDGPIVRQVMGHAVGEEWKVGRIDWILGGLKALTSLVSGTHDLTLATRNTRELAWVPELRLLNPYDDGDST